MGIQINEFLVKEKNWEYIEKKGRLAET